MFEMLSGRRAFPGNTAADAVSAILAEDRPRLPASERQIPAPWSASSTEIINALTKLPGVKVIARTSAFAFKGQHGDIRRIAEALG